MLAAAAASFATMLVLDIPWVTLNTRYGLYKGKVNGIVTNRAAVGAIWVAILIMNSLLVGYIASTASKWWAATLACAFCGLAVYATFNGTSVVLFDSWPAATALGDTAWGAVLFAAAGTAAYFAASAAATTRAAGGSEGEEKT